MGVTFTILGICKVKDLPYSAVIICHVSEAMKCCQKIIQKPVEGREVVRIPSMGVRVDNQHHNALP